MGERRVRAEDPKPQPLPLSVPVPLAAPLDVLADHPPEGDEPQVEVAADAGEAAGIEPARLQHPDQAVEVSLDGRPVEAILDPPREDPHLEKVHEPLEPGALPPRADPPPDLPPPPSPPHLPPF